MALGLDLQLCISSAGLLTLAFFFSLKLPIDPQAWPTELYYFIIHYSLPKNLGAVFPRISHVLGPELGRQV